MYSTTKNQNLDVKRQPLGNLSHLVKYRINQLYGYARTIESLSKERICTDKRRKDYVKDRQWVFESALNQLPSNFFNEETSPFHTRKLQWLFESKENYFLYDKENTISDNTTIYLAMTMQFLQQKTKPFSWLNLTNLKTTSRFYVQHYATKLLEITTNCRFVEYGNRYFPIIETEVSQQYYGSNTTNKRTYQLPLYVYKNVYFPLKNDNENRQTQTYINCFNEHCEHIYMGYVGSGGRFTKNGIENTLSILKRGI